MAVQHRYVVKGNPGQGRLAHRGLDIDGVGVLLPNKHVPLAPPVALVAGLAPDGGTVPSYREGTDTGTVHTVPEGHGTPG